jgi:two-component system NtrC family sensor kinase
VISRSQTDIQPVFDTIVANAVNLCGARFGALFRFDGELLHLVAHHHYVPAVLEVMRRTYPRPPHSDQVSGRTILTGAVVQVEDMLTDSTHLQETATTGGWRSILSVPMLRDGMPIGAIVITRAETGRFADGQIDLLKVFADQAVIAIENARLLTELQARTQQLTRSVDQLTALREVGHAVSSSLDLETVLNTIVARAVQLAGAHSGTIWEYDAAAEEFVLRITQNVEDPELRENPNARVRRGEGAVGRLAVSQRPVQIPDITHEGAYEGR